jgi:hypothetical protein
MNDRDAVEDEMGMFRKEAEAIALKTMTKGSQDC